MKRHSDSEKVLVQMKAEADVEGLINKIQERLISLERKIDILVNRPSAQTNERRFEHSYRDDRGRQGGDFRERQGSDFRERKFYKVICADCGKECEVPFKPSSDRPVYCRECFSKRKSGGGSFKEKRDKMPIMSGESRKFSKEKKRFSPRKKSNLRRH